MSRHPVVNASNATLTVERLRELLAYDPETGALTWRVRRRGGGCRVGDVAGCPSRGYLIVGVDKRQYLAHRLAWLHFYGDWPEFEIDHINGVKSDNRIANLRDVDHQTNQHNNMHGLRRGNKTGYQGAYLVGGKWRAAITVNERTSYLGMYDTAAEAHRAYLAAKAEVHLGWPA